MVKFEVEVKSIEDLENIYKMASKQSFEVDAGHGTHVVDAKSFMGLMSLSIPNMIEFECHADAEDAEEFVRSVNDIGSGD